MPACWEQRGCDEAMSAQCPHATQAQWSPCLLDCMYTICDRPQHVETTDLDLLLDPTIDRQKAVKMGCCTCENFLKNGPRLNVSSV